MGFYTIYTRWYIRTRLENRRTAVLYVRGSFTPKPDIAGSRARAPHNNIIIQSVGDKTRRKSRTRIRVFFCENPTGFCNWKNIVIFPIIICVYEACCETNENSFIISSYPTYYISYSWRENGKCIWWCLDESAPPPPTKLYRLGGFSKIRFSRHFITEGCAHRVIRAGTVQCIPNSDHLNNDISFFLLRDFDLHIGLSIFNRLYCAYSDSSVRLTCIWYS